MNDEKLDALLKRALPEPDPAATARMRARLAAEIARRPMPGGGTSFWQRILPAGCGALGMAAICAFWLVHTKPAPVAESSADVLSVVSALPFSEDNL
ncbi:hypothetical protein IAI18_15035 [Acetobacteraceae bacterium H6797]|nr:hypothetical protein [Acetobacteraceae bacterium H6797]